MKRLSFLILFFAFFSLIADDSNNEKGIFAQPTQDGGYISVGSTESLGIGASDIFLTKTNANGEEIWSKTYGGTSYEQGSYVQATEDGGYIVLGSTSSYGKGNYDVFLIKTDDEGREVWTQTYGGFYNEYGHTVEQTEDGGYLITAKKQICQAHNDWSNCHDEAWMIKTDRRGNKVWNKIGEKEE